MIAGEGGPPEGGGHPSMRYFDGGVFLRKDVCEIRGDGEHHGFTIGEKKIGAKEPCLVIAEIAQSHDGSLGMAHAYIDAVAAAGADAVKFQTHIAEAESSIAEPWRIPFSFQDASRFDYWRRMEFTQEQWVGLKEHADAKGLIFLSSPFSAEACVLLTAIGVPAWKLASGETSDPALVAYMLGTGLPLLISSGMSPLAETDRLVQRACDVCVPFAVMQCTTAYPCPPEKIGLNMLELYKERYACPVGLSDHSGTIWPGLAAVVKGCQLLEVHVTMSREMFGPDVASSVTTGELRQMVEGMRQIETILAHPVDKDKMARENSETRGIFSKSLVAAKDLVEGELLTVDDVVFRKPGTGIPATDLPRYLGRRLKCTLPKGTFLSEDHLTG